VNHLVWDVRSRDVRLVSPGASGPCCLRVMIPSMTAPCGKSK
jgi:hypothetical protein